jgi:hypothetical protein
MFVFCTVFVLSGRGLCDGPIPRSEEFYRLWCVSECDQMKIKTVYTYFEQADRRGKDYEKKHNLQYLRLPSIRKYQTGTGYTKDESYPLRLKRISV